MLWRPEQCTVKLDSGSHKRLGGRLPATARWSVSGNGFIAALADASAGAPHPGPLPVAAIFWG